MNFDADSAKAALDIGLGALSLMLWARQGKTNSIHLKANQDLAAVVQNHDHRIVKLEKRRRK